MSTSYLSILIVFSFYHAGGTTSNFLKQFFDYMTTTFAPEMKISNKISLNIGTRLYLFSLQIVVLSFY